MDEERFDFENLRPRTPNSELRTIFQRKSSFDEILLQLTGSRLSAQPVLRKVLFWGERTGEISSYVAGWLAGKGIDVIVLDGANHFDPYMASSFARKVFISPERLLKRIQIARAFTCYQMATLMGERLSSFLKEEEEKPWVIILGPLTTFLDEDVPEREVRPLLERSLKRIEEVALRGVPFLLFQSNGFPDSKRIYLASRLFQFSNLVWRLSLGDEGPKIVLEKGIGLNLIENCKLQNEKFKFVRKNLPSLSVDRKIL